MACQTDFMRFDTYTHEFSFVRFETLDLMTCQTDFMKFDTHKTSLDEIWCTLDSFFKIGRAHV